MIERHPKCHEAYFGIGKNYFHLGAFEHAKTYFERAIKARKDNVYVIWMGYNYLFYILQLTKLIHSSQGNKTIQEKAKSTRDKAYSSCLKYLGSKSLECDISHRVQQEKR